jgi:zinc transporter ZupT
MKSPEATVPRSKTRWWLWAVLSPIVALLVGVITAMLLGQHQDDWLGMRAIAPVVFSLFAGCTLSCVFAIISLEKKEARSALALVAAIPSGLFVAFAILGQFGYLK